MLIPRSKSQVVYLCQLPGYGNDDSYTFSGFNYSYQPITNQCLSEITLNIAPGENKTSKQSSGATKP